MKHQAAGRKIVWGRREIAEILNRESGERLNKVAEAEEKKGDSHQIGAGENDNGTAEIFSGTR